MVGTEGGPSYEEVEAEDAAPQVPPSMLQKIIQITKLSPDIIHRVLPSTIAVLGAHVAACLVVPLDLPAITSLNGVENELYSELCADTISTLMKDKGIIHGHVDMIEAIGELISDERGQDVSCSLKAIVTRIHLYISER